MPDAESAPRCTACGASQARVHRVGPHRLWRCPACSAVFHRPFSPADAASRFAPAYFRGSVGDGYADYLAEGPTLQRQAGRYLALLASMTTGRRLFDVGCAAGFLLREARSRGWQVAGCDVSDWAVREAQAAGLDVRREAFDATSVEPAAEQTVDVVTMLNVLEHCAEPARAVERAWRMLAPGGLLCIETWDRQSWVARTLGARWHQWSPERVTTWFTRDALQALVGPPAWTWVRYGPVTRWISLARGLEVLGLPVPSGARAMDLPYRMGDLVMLVAKRRDA